jgi:hypothetical protein
MKQMPVGIVITELAMWEFSGDEETIRHHVNTLANAIIMGYNLTNFGPGAFNLSDEE